MGDGRVAGKVTWTGFFLVHTREQCQKEPGRRSAKYGRSLEFGGFLKWKFTLFSMIIIYNLTHRVGSEIGSR